MKKHFVRFAALALVATFGLTACQKEDVETSDSQISASQSSSEAGNLVEDVNDEAEYRLSPSTAITGCPTITFASAQGTYPNTITIDYGTGCVAQNGRTMAGKIIVDVSAGYYAQGAVRTTHTDNFTVDGNSLDFTRTVTNQGLNGAGQMYWSVVVSGTRVKASDGTTGTWTADRVRTMVAGQATTDDMLDDVVEITGTATGTCREGRAFSSSITTPLVKRADCKWIVSGVEQTTVSGRNGARSLDFGDGSCDDKGIITLPNGTTREITLHRRMR
jgi:hypothetical protein